MPETITTGAIKLAIPRHLQDYNGYCGPACAMMVLDQTDSSPTGSQLAKPVPGQPELFRSIRAYAKESSDKRPIKSPAESLLTLLVKQSGQNWKKFFDPEPAPIAELVLRSIQQAGQPALMLISKGMHWVVAFGRTLKEDGTPAGVLLRDPAWAGMPAFFGLSIYPEKTTFSHSSAQGACTCLQSDHQAGTVHERYLALDELLSPRGLQGTPDWEGRGAIALMPAEVSSAAAIKLVQPANGIAGAAAVAAVTAYASPAEAALPQALEHGLYGRADSPPDWQAALDGGQPGEPILVKDPDDPRDDFYLVPIISQGQKGQEGHPSQQGQKGSTLASAANRTAWIMLDAQTLKLREASLLDNWKTPVLPNRQDTQKVSENTVLLPDGTTTQYRATELKPNQKNLVWKASAATILPYWPVKEWLAPHPLTGEPVSIFQTQEGKIYTALTPDEPLPSTPKALAAPESTNVPSAKPGKPWLATCAGIVAGAAGGFLWPRPAPPPPTYTMQVQKSITQLETTAETDAGNNGTLKIPNKEKLNDLKSSKERIEELTRKVDKITADTNPLRDKIKQLEKEREDWQETILKLNAELANRPDGPGPDKRVPTLNGGGGRGGNGPAGTGTGTKKDGNPKTEEDFDRSAPPLVPPLEKFRSILQKAPSGPEPKPTGTPSPRIYQNGPTDPAPNNP